VLVLAIAAVPIVVYWGTVASMIESWSSESYRHGYLIPIVCVLLLWRDRANFGPLRLSGSWVGIAALALTVGAWLVAQATAVELVEQVSVVSMVTAFALAVVGWQAYRRIWFPLAYLIFTVPVGASLIPYLMDSTATIAVGALQSLDVPALREGMVVSLPGGTFEVVEACSGFSYLNAGVALGVLVAHLMFRAAWKQVSYVAAVVAVFIVVNGVRAFLVMFVGSLSHMRIFVGRDHLFFGWLLSAMALMYWVAEKYSDVQTAEPARGAE